MASLARRLGRLDIAEDAAQDAIALAIRHWPVHGTPANAAAWLMTAAWRRAIDLLRHQTRHPTTSLPDDALRHELRASAMAAGDAADDHVTRLADLRRDDDLLTLLLACCHPALNREARLALTLRHVAGLTAREIAAMFRVPVATMDKRLVRARVKIRDAGIRFELPGARDLESRVADVRLVIYLLFTEGYLSSGDGDAVRDTLCNEALWLARQLFTQRPFDAECRGLLALLLLQHSRIAARRDPAGALLSFAEQDRALWNGHAVHEARELLSHSAPQELGAYQVEAAIALLHATAPSAHDTPWKAIASLYSVLHRLTESDVVAVNGAYARGRAGEYTGALATLEAMQSHASLAGYAPLYAAHADLLERVGRIREAHVAWRRAAECADNAAQRTWLAARASP